VLQQLVEHLHEGSVILDVDVNKAAGLLINAPVAQSAPVLSRKYFNAEAMLPNRVGLPMARPAHSRRSASEQYTAPVGGTAGIDGW
jgi:hypothetical protein